MQVVKISSYEHPELEILCTFSNTLARVTIELPQSEFCDLGNQKFEEIGNFQDVWYISASELGGLTEAIRACKCREKAFNCTVGWTF